MGNLRSQGPKSVHRRAKCTCRPNGPCTDSMKPWVKTVRTLKIKIIKRVYDQHILEHVWCTYNSPVLVLKKRVSYVSGHCNFLPVLLLHSNFCYFSLGLAHKQVVIRTHNQCVLILAYSGQVEIPNLFPLVKKWILSKPHVLVGLLHSVKHVTLLDDTSYALTLY